MSKYITIICLTLILISQIYFTGRASMFILFPLYGIFRGIKAFFNNGGEFNIIDID